MNYKAKDTNGASDTAVRKKGTTMAQGFWKLGRSGAALAAVLVMACGGGGDAIDEASSPGERAETSTAVSATENDTTAATPSAALPGGWPAAFPAPPSGTVLTEVKGPLVQDDKVIYTVDYIAEDGDLRELFAYYLTELPAAGWQGRFDVDPTGAQRVATTQFEGEGASGNIMFDDNLGRVLIRILMTIDR